jgi:endonuclease/exonuclease/phosphatase family metal-dependent hydrolase
LNHPSTAPVAVRGRAFLAEFGAALVCLGVAPGCALAQNYDDPNGPRYFAEFAPPPDESDSSELAVCSFNIEFSRDIDGAIADLRGDENLRACRVLLLQEMDWPGASAIAEALALDVVYYPGSVQKGRDFGNAVLSRWPIVDDQKLILPHRNPTNGRIRIAVRATLDAPGAPLTAYSVHSDTPWLGPAARLEQAEAVAIDATRFAAPIAAGGDFNTSDPGSVEHTVALYAKRGFTWASAGVAPTAEGPLGARSLDHLFVKGLSVVKAGTVSTDASDHQPIWVELRIPP